MITQLLAYYRRSFRVRLFLALALMILIFIPTVGYISYRQVRNIAENQMQQYVEATAEQIVKRVSSFLAQHSNNVVLIGSLMDNHFIDFKDRQKMLRYFRMFKKGHPEFVNINCGSEKGDFLMVPPQSPEIHKIYDPRTRPWYVGATQSKKLFWTDVYLFASSQKPGITVSVPVMEKNGKLQGACAIDVDLSQFSRFLRGIEMRKQGIAYIFENDQGHVIAHSGLAKLFWKPDQLDLARQSIDALNKIHKTSGHTIFHGKDYYTALTDYPGQNWTVGVTLSMSDYNHNIQFIKQTTVSLVILGIIFSSLLSLLLSRTIVRPLHLLRQGIERISKGDLDHKVDIRDPDIASDLASSFNKMATSLRQSLNDLQAASRELAEKEKLAAVGQMTASIAHEIKNPLGVIHGAAQVVANPGKPLEMREKAAKFITEEVQRLNTTITSFLAFAKPAPPSFQPVDIINQIEATLSAVEERYGREGYRFVRNYPDHDMPVIQADGDQLRQVFWNIFLNSFEAMVDGGTLTIRVRVEEVKKNEGQEWPPVVLSNPFAEQRRIVTVIITDTGCGMNSEQLKRVTDPFVSYRDGGTGLGLSIVAQIMKLHGGKVRIESTPGEGTSFYLFFPYVIKEN